MKILYIIEKIEDTYERLTDPSHSFYSIGFILGRILLFAIGFGIGIVAKSVIIGLLLGYGIL